MTESFDLIYEICEQWKPCRDYPYYEVSDQGRVRIAKTGHVMKQWVNNCGYSMVHLRYDKHGNTINKQCLVSRLVAQEFVPNPDPARFTEINHKSVKSDNRSQAIEWCDRRYNMNYGDLMERRACHGGSRLIVRKGRDGNVEKVYHSMREVTNDGYDRKAVSLCARGKQMSHRGRLWEIIYYPPVK